MTEVLFISVILLAMHQTHKIKHKLQRMMQPPALKMCITQPKRGSKALTQKTLVNTFLRIINEWSQVWLFYLAGLRG